MQSRHAGLLSVPPLRFTQTTVSVHLDSETWWTAHLKGDGAMAPGGGPLPR